MDFLGFLLTMIISSLPTLWIEDYKYDNPIWWTVLIVWLLGRTFGYIEGLKEN